MDRLTGRMGSVPILSVKRSVSIGTMANFDGHGGGDGTCKQALRVRLQQAEVGVAMLPNPPHAVCFPL